MRVHGIMSRLWASWSRQGGRARHNPPTKPPLDVHKQALPQCPHCQEDAIFGVRVHGISEEVVPSAAAMRALLERGHSRRRVSSHRMNHLSSRSHALFRVRTK